MRVCAMRGVGCARLRRARGTAGIAREQRRQRAPSPHSAIPREAAEAALNGEDEL